ncbi:MAG: hypothetical protein AAFR31_15950 [Cyanobacteria bacterium J06627_8]
MAVRNLLLLILLVASLVIFILGNMTPVVPLVILGTQTQAFPLAIWLLGAIAAGALTTLLIAGLIQIAATPPRSRVDRFYADRPQYRPAKAEPLQEDEDWEVIDLDDDRASADRVETRSAQSSADARSSTPIGNWFNSNRGDRRSRVNQSKASRSTASGSAASSLDDWNRFTVRRTEWDDWNTYEEAAPSVKNSGRPADNRTVTNQYSAGPETVIQDSVDRDWQEWSTYRDNTSRDSSDSTFRDEYDASDGDHAAFRRNDELPVDDESYRGRAYDDGAYDDGQDEFYEADRPQWTSSDDRYDTRTVYDDDEYENDEYGDGEYRDSGYRAGDYASDATSIDDALEDGVDDSSWRRDSVGSDGAADGYESSVEDEYDSADYGDDRADDEIDGSGWQSEPSASDEYYTVHYTEDDDYYDDYDDYAADGRRSPRSSRDASADDSDTHSSDIDSDFSEFDDWEAENTAQPDGAAEASTSQPSRRIYEVPQRPTAVNQSGTLYSYRYRSSSDQPVSSDEPSNHSDDQGIEHSPSDSMNETNSAYQDVSQSDEQPSSEPRILTTPPPDGSEPDTPVDQQ